MPKVMEMDVYTDTLPGAQPKPTAHSFSITAAPEISSQWPAVYTSQTMERMPPHLIAPQIGPSVSSRKNTPGETSRKLLQLPTSTRAPSLEL